MIWKTDDPELRRYQTVFKVILAIWLALFAVLVVWTTVGARGVQDEYPLAPCDRVIMMSAPDESDGGILAYCAGNEFFVYDEQDEQWYHMTLTHLRGYGIMPVRDDRVASLTRWADMVGDHRAVGMYD